MSASASRNVVEPADGTDTVLVGTGRGIRLVWVEAAVAVVAFAALCVVVFSVPGPRIAVEPDDGAYHYSIVAITMGDLLPLSNAQLNALDAKMGPSGSQVPNQWVHLSNGRYISEKNPGYAYVAAPFEALGIIRLAPLFFGALACLGLFLGARRWLGRFGGTAAVGLFCSSGAAMIFAWRIYIPTFTDASLIAAGSGILLWAVLATEAGSSRRTWAGLAGLVALELATFVRYTNIVILSCAVVTVLVAWWLGTTRLPLRTLCWWLGSVAVFGAGVALFDDVVYGAPLTTGYASGEITFSVGAIGPNLRLMPPHLMGAMPTLVLGLVASVWIVARWLVLRERGNQAGVPVRRDLWVALAMAASWFAIWGLYAAYTWTVDESTDASTMLTLTVIRFYVPAMGAISLLGAWLVTRVPDRAWLTGLTTAAVITGLFVQGVMSFHAMWAWAVS
jgi:hypothetical protein